MSRSRSSFDLSGAIATATSLSVTTPEEAPGAIYRSVPLVSFGPTASGPPTVMPEALPQNLGKPPPPLPVVPPPTSIPGAEDSISEASGGDVSISARTPTSDPAPGPSEGTRKPPKLPDLSGVKDPLARCERILSWIQEAVGAAHVFIVDAAGLRVAGGQPDAEAALAATGVVAAAVAHLANSIPGNSSSLFEMHVGDGPFFQAIGFEAGGASFVVGLSRPTPLGFRQAHAVRLACRHALDTDNAGTVAS